MTDYRKTKTSALQQLAASGDTVAVEELARRGVERGAVVDVTTLDYHGLRALVQRWNEGITPEERARTRELAERAHEELDVRYVVERKLGYGTGDISHEPPTPPWLVPRPPRVANWRRPSGSKLYPSETERYFFEVGSAMTRRLESAAGAPRKEQL